MLLYKLVFIHLLFLVANASRCAERLFGPQAIVCVCNETFCDDLEISTVIPKGKATLYETNRDGKRFDQTFLSFNPSFQNDVPTITFNSSQMYQFILGFGGAFTDAAGINVVSLSKKLQSRIMDSYFSNNGLEYNMGRVPMASCDFSTREYSYADVAGDFSLKNFSLTKEDFLYKIPLISTAQSIAINELLLFSSPWSAPSWMKTNNRMSGQGSLKGNPGGKYYKSWANYFIKFLESYKAQNITFWGVTAQNEPSDGCVRDFAFQAMCFTPETQRDFLKMDLGPALWAAGFTPDKMRLMALDDDRMMLPKWIDIIMADKEAAKYVSGTAFHWYFEDLNPHKILDITHKRHPNLFLLATEACAGYAPWEFPKVSLGDWSRAERYAHDIIQDLLNWSIGWIDWNLVLNEQGGPNWVKNYVDAPIIVKADLSEFYKQPMYYAMAHFSKCLARGSYRIGFDVSNQLPKKLELAAFRTPQDQTVLIAVNRGDEDAAFNIHDLTEGYLNISVTAHSIQSYMW